MLVTLGGVRGSVPRFSSGCSRYGMDTTSVLVEGVDGDVILIDLGTGAQHLAETLCSKDPLRALVLFSHYHLDHLYGLPMFPLLYTARSHLIFAAPLIGRRSVAHVLSQLMSAPYWPIRLQDMPARVQFRTLRRSGPLRSSRWGGLRIRWTPVHHGSGGVAYRVDEVQTGSSFVFATDLEWSESSPAERLEFMQLVREPVPAQALFFDAQYTPGEYKRKCGWGHSRWTDAIEIARAAEVPLVRMIHHAPHRNDSELDRIDQRVRKSYPGARVGRQGEKIRLSSN